MPKSPLQRYESYSASVHWFDVPAESPCNEILIKNRVADSFKFLSCIKFFTRNVLSQSWTIVRMVEKFRYVEFLVLETRSGLLTIFRNSFQENYLVLLPSNGINSFVWVGLMACWWDAPRDMQTRHPLESLYDVHFHWSETSKSTFMQFFRATLGVRDCAWDNFVDELKGHRPWESEVQVCHFYDLRIVLSFWQDNRKAFEDNALIFVPVGGDRG